MFLSDSSDRILKDQSNGKMHGFIPKSQLDYWDVIHCKADWKQLAGITIQFGYVLTEPTPCSPA